VRSKVLIAKVTGRHLYETPTAKPNQTSHNWELTTGLDSERKAHGEHPPMVVRVEVRDGNLGAARH
jgi:hypothetical protein